MKVAKSNSSDIVMAAWSQRALDQIVYVQRDIIVSSIVERQRNGKFIIVVWYKILIVSTLCSSEDAFCVIFANCYYYHSDNHDSGETDVEYPICSSKGKVY